MRIADFERQVADEKRDAVEHKRYKLILCAGLESAIGADLPRCQRRRKQRR